MEDDTTFEIEWTIAPSRSEAATSQRAQAIREHAQQTLDGFNDHYFAREIEREELLPQLSSSDLVVSTCPIRHLPFHVEYKLLEAKASKTLGTGGFQTFAMTKEDHYSIKFLREGIIDLDQTKTAVQETIVEVYILMNLQKHPSVCQVHAICGSGLDSFLNSGTDGYCYATDHIVETLPERLNQWREGNGYQDDSTPEITQRLLVALDIASAMLHLHARQLACYIRPDKVGFDSQQNKVKVFGLGQSRKFGAANHPKDISLSDNASVLAYTAPEVLCGGCVSPGIDVFGLGIMLWELVGLQQPFQDVRFASEHFERVVKGGERPETDELWESNTVKLLRRTWDPHQRVTMKALYDSINIMAASQDPSCGEFDVAKKMREKAKKESARKCPVDGGRPSVPDSVLVSLDTLKDLEETFHRAASKINAVRGNSRSAATRNDKVRQRRKQDRVGQAKKKQMNKHSSRSMFRETDQSGSTAAEAALDTSTEDEHGSDDNFHSSVLSEWSPNDLLVQSSSKDMKTEEDLSLRPRSQSRQQLLLRETRKKEEKEQPVFAELKENNKAFQGRRSSAGYGPMHLDNTNVGELTQPTVNSNSFPDDKIDESTKAHKKGKRGKEGRRASTGEQLEPVDPVAPNVEELLQPAVQSISSSDGKIDESTKAHKKAKRGKERRRASMGELLELKTCQHEKPLQTTSPTLPKKQRSSRQLAATDRREAFARANSKRRQPQSLSRRKLESSTPENRGRSFRQLQMKDSEETDLPKVPVRASSSDSIRHKVVEKPSLNRERRCSHEEFMDLLNARSTQSERPSSPAGKENKRSGIMKGLRKMGISSRQLFQNSMSALPLHDDSVAST